MPFGLTHTGILVDDICINWGRGLIGKSLIYPWINCKYNDYIYAIELNNNEIWTLIKETLSNITDFITNKKKYELLGTIKAFAIADSQLDAIAETCVDYNINRKYHLIKENCQGFTKTILKKIKLKPNKKGEVGKVLKKVEDKGDIIDFTYDALAKALTDAIDSEAKEHGNQFVTNEREVTNMVKEYDFDALMKQFEEQVGALMGKDQDYYAPRITQIVEKYLGKGKKISNVTRDQAGLVYLVVSEIDDELIKK